LTLGEQPKHMKSCRLKECFHIQARGLQKRVVAGICSVCPMVNPALNGPFCYAYTSWTLVETVLHRGQWTQKRSFNLISVTAVEFALQSQHEAFSHFGT